MIHRPGKALRTHLVCTTSVAATLFCSLAFASPLSQRIDECVAKLEPKEPVSVSVCPKVFSVLGESKQSITDTLEFSDPLVREDLSAISRFLQDIGPRKPSAARILKQSDLSEIMADYSFEQHEESISLAARFSAWLAEKLRQYGITDRLDSLGDRFSMDRETFMLIVKIIGWTMGLALAAALLCFLWVLWRYIDPTLRRRRTNLGDMGAGTGEQRGNMPVMALSAIRELPANQQPAALLVACLDRMRGKELPENIWKATNSEIVRRLNRQQSRVTAPMRRLIQIAERTLYGEQAAEAHEIASCFDAAEEIFTPQATSA